MCNGYRMNSFFAPHLPSSNRKKSQLISIIIPFYNESPVLELCLSRLVNVLETTQYQYELIFVDDGSEDGGAHFLERKARYIPQLKILRLSRNFGKEAAMTAGLDHVKGDATIIIDADLQDPPEKIPEMLAVWEKGANVVLMKRRTRDGETWLKKLTSSLYYRFLNKLSHCTIPEDVGDFRLLDQKAVEALKTLPERNRYMKGLYAWIGLKTEILLYDRDPRAQGVTKWDYLKLFRLAIEGITSFSTSPLHWASFIGFSAALLGAVYGVWIVLKALMLGDSVQGFPSIIAVITFLGGIQLLTIGILGEYVGKTYIESKQRPNYLIQKITAGEDYIQSGVQFTSMKVAQND
ncbi:glycosyltransferase [Sessilibacter sp. MAH4]